MKNTLTLHESINRMKQIIGLPVKTLTTEDILSLVYKADHIGLNSEETNILNEAVDFGKIYTGKLSKTDKRASGLERKYKSKEDYVNHVNQIINTSPILQKIFNTGTEKIPTNPFETELSNTRIVADNKLILKRAMELRNKFGDKDYLKKHCTVDDKFENTLLDFSESNEKLDHHFISLPAAMTCPGAGSCLSLYDPELDVLMVGSDNKGGICYAAAAEERFPNVREKVYKNLYLILYHLKNGSADLANFLVKSIELSKKPIRILRIHEDGDIWTPPYLEAWILTAQKLKTVHFYFYTKNAKVLLNVLKKFNGIPENIIPILSQGYDKSQEESIKKLQSMGYKTAKIFNSYDDAMASGLPIDKTDAYAFDPDYKGDLALVYHGSGLAKTDFAKYAKTNKADDRREKTDADKKHYMKTVDKIRYNQTKDL